MRLDPPSPKIEIRCSFCRKRPGAVDHIVAGPGVQICTRCLALCSEILVDHNPAT
ncbi:MAG: hypothetical protein GEV03_23560 [Streptosporangiales bacterium]|nr:hypothetical protein [Streptosporangiales bacterium]